MLIAITPGGTTRFEVCQYTAEYLVIRILFEGVESFESCLKNMWDSLEDWVSDRYEFVEIIGNETL